MITFRYLKVLENIGMTVGCGVSRASHAVVYIDAPLERRNFGLSAGVSPFLRLNMLQ